MKMPKIKQSENEVKKAIRQHLELQGYKVYRINNAGMFRGYNKQGEQRFSFAGDTGVADLYAIKNGDYPLWIETKATGKTPSKDQEDFGKNINKTFGTLWLWADSFDMFLPIYNDIKNEYGLPGSRKGELDNA